MTIHTNHVVEICRAAPDILVAILRDANVGPGMLFNKGEADGGSLFSIVQRDRVTGGAGSDYAMVVGGGDTSKHYLRFLEKPPQQFIDRDVIMNPANYAASDLGGRTVTNVYCPIKPYAQGWHGSGAAKIVAMEYVVFLELDDVIGDGGPFTLRIAGNTFPFAKFVLNEEVTRAYGLQVSHVGYRPNGKRKLVDFSIHIPGYGTEGQFDIADYEIDDLDIIDQSGDVVGTYDLDVLYAPTDVEPNVPNLRRIDGANTNVAQNAIYASTTTPPLQAISVSNDNPRIIETSTEHGLESGAIVLLRGFNNAAGTILEFDPAYRTVTVIDPTHFSIATGADQASWGAGTSYATGAIVSHNGTFYIALRSTVGDDPESSPSDWAEASWDEGYNLEGYDGLIFTTHDANQYATYVHRADISALETPGHYKACIRGVGVSSPFPINDAVYKLHARQIMKAYYGQLAHNALDADIGGWSRGAAYCDGVNGREVYKSMCPSIFSSETGIMPETYRFTARTLVLSPWITETRVTGFAPSVLRDAGDNDYFTNTHPEMTYRMLEYGYRHLPAESRDIRLGWPIKASSLDPELFAGTDDIGDQFHMAVAGWHGYYQHQAEDGSVFSGVAFSSGGGGNAEGGMPGGHMEPSDISNEEIAVLPADPISQYMYVCAGTKIAQVLKDGGFNAAAATIFAKMEAAYAWSEAQYTDYKANGAAGSVIQDYWINTLDFQTRAGWDGTKFAAMITALFTSNRFIGMRMRAAAALYCYSDDDTAYGDIIGNPDAAMIGAGYNKGMSLTGHGGFAVWDFVQAPSSAQYTMSNGIDSMRDYYNVRWTATHIERPWEEVVRAFLRELITDTATANSTYLKWMNEWTSRDTGRLQGGGRSMTVGYPRSPNNILIRDREGLCLPGSVCPGARLYHNNITGVSHTIFGGININNFISDSPANWLVEVPTGNFAYWRERLINPIRFQTPVIEGFWDNSFVIYSTEFTSQQSIEPQLDWAVIQHAWDGSDADVPPLSQLRVKLRREGAA